MGERRIEYLPLDVLLDADRNAKDHDQATLGKSMDRFGFMQSIFLDDRTGKIVGGHGRRDKLRDMRDAGDRPPADVRVDEAGEWLVPVERGWESADDEEAEAAAIALNRVGEGKWKRDVLWATLDDLSKSKKGLDGIGYRKTDLEDLAAQMGAAPSLEDLQAKHTSDKKNDPSIWSAIHVLVPPSLSARWSAFCDKEPEREPFQQFESLLDAADA